LQIYTHLPKHKNKNYTNRLKQYIDLTKLYNDKINFVDRGKEPNGFARLRVDVGNWGWQEGVEYMDAHLPRNPLENFELVYDLIKSKINTDIEWINQYTKEFRQLAE
jgi:hypothetical protein